MNDKQKAEELAIKLEGEIGTSPHSRQAIEEALLEMTEWKDNEMQETIEVAEDHAFFAGSYRERDYKQKYEQALERCKKEFNFNNLAYSHEEIKQRLEHIFPELKESEDEEIRKEIIECLKNNALGYPEQTRNKWIACLEKQGEQKPEIKYIYPKFRVGDVIEPSKPNGDYVPVRVTYIGEGNYSCESDDHKAFLSFPICHENNYVLTEQKPAWSEEDERRMQQIISDLEQCTVPGFPIYIGGIELEINWLKSLKERMKGETK